jgi:bifunctional non-homologous end joining protein LigD
MSEEEPRQLELPFGGGAPAGSDAGQAPAARAPARPPLSGSEAPPASRLPRRFRPMQPLLGEGPFDDPDYRFEPWWPGLRVLLAVEGSAVRLQAEQLADPLAVFPELARVAALLSADGVVLDGTLLVLDADGRPDADLLRERLSYPEVRDGAPAFVASDLLYAGGAEVMRRPYADRLTQLQALLRETDWCMVARGYAGEGRTVAAALEAMGLQAMSARHLASRYRPGRSQGEWLRLPLVPAPQVMQRPTLALIQRLGL